MKSEGKFGPLEPLIAFVVLLPFVWVLGKIFDYLGPWASLPVTVSVIGLLIWFSRKLGKPKENLDRAD